MLSPIIYANTIVKKALDTNTPLSPMKLQKILYFMYARYGALYGIALFSDQFEPWPYGPVVSEVYEEFRRFGSRSIDEFAKDCDGNVSVADESYTPFAQCLAEVWQRFSGHDGIYLSKLTHEPETAWSKAWMEKNFLVWEDIIADGQRFFQT